MLNYELVSNVLILNVFSRAVKQYLNLDKLFKYIALLAGIGLRHWSSHSVDTNPKNSKKQLSAIVFPKRAIKRSIEWRAISRTKY